MPVDGIDDKIVPSQVMEPLTERPALRNHELDLPPMLDWRGEVDEPDHEEDEGAEDYLEEEGPGEGRGGREGGREGGGGEYSRNGEDD